MIKRFCDRCGVEETPLIVRTYAVLSQVGANHIPSTMDLCTNCVQAIKEFVRRG